MSTNTLGERIKDAADEVGGLTQLAESLAVARRTIGDWVRNASEPKASQVISISEMTGVELQWLLVGSGPKYKDKLRSSDETGDVVSPPGQTAVDVRALQPDILIDIEQAIQTAYASARGAVSRHDALRLSIAWYNEIAQHGVDMTDGREIAGIIYDKRKVLETELKSRASGEATSGKRRGS